MREVRGDDQNLDFVASSILGMMLILLSQLFQFWIQEDTHFLKHKPDSEFSMFIYIQFLF